MTDDEQPITALTIPDTAGLILSNPQPMDQNPAAVYLASLIANSGRRTQAQCLRYIAQWLGGTIESVNWSALRYQHTAALRTVINNLGYEPSTVRKYYSALRGVLLNAWRLGQMNADDYQRAIDLGKIKGEGETEAAGRYIKKTELDALMKVCNYDPNPSGVRDSAIIAMLYFEGLRRSESVELDMEHYDPISGKTYIHGKGNKKRFDFMTNEGKAAVRDWLHLRGDAPGPLFLAIRRNGTIRYGKPMTDQAVYNMIKNRVKQAGLRNISPHDFRRTSVSDSLTAGTDVLMAAKKYGHADPKTTQKYDRRPEGEIREAAKRLHITYVPKLRGEEWKEDQVQEIYTEEVREKE